MRNAAIADTSATHNHSKESKRGRMVALLVLLLTQGHIAPHPTLREVGGWAKSVCAGERSSLVLRSTAHVNIGSAGRIGKLQAVKVSVCG
jgi:hypothetical protein